MYSLIKLPRPPHTLLGGIDCAALPSTSSILISGRTIAQGDPIVDFACTEGYQLGQIDDFYKHARQELRSDFVT